MKSIFSFIFLSLITHFCVAQVSFTNATNKLQNPNLYSGFVMGITDMNADGLDDVIRFQEGKQLEIEYQQNDGSFSRNIFGPILGNERVWSLAVADTDDNGYNDLITGGFYVDPILALNNGTSFDLDTLVGPLLYMQAANFVDINNDGLIDYFACNDDGLSNSYRHDGDNLIYDPNLMDSSSPNGPVNSGNYGTIWTDYDNDGDIDMYLSKCRLGVTNPLDERRMNIFFENDGNNNFSDVADDVGLRPLGQTWAIDFGDIDNDGDLDAFMINHDIGSFLYENDGTHHFTDITAQSGIDGSITALPLGFQLFFEDFDNDGFIDLLLTSYEQNTHPILYMNNGDKTFSPESVFDAPMNSIQSCALGDLNSDGAIDLIAGFANGVNFPNSLIPDVLLLNDGNINNYINIRLDGFESNKNGIGARLEIFGDWGKQSREIRSGQSYGIMNSLNVHFGIGQSTMIDSLVVKWPSGKRTTTENPAINSLHTMIEAIVETQPTINICEGEEAIIYDQPQTMSGIYYDTLQGTDADTILQTTLIVNPHYEIKLPTQFFCLSDSINGEPIEAGSYIEMLQSFYGCDSIIVTHLEPFSSFNYNTTAIEPGSTQIGSISIHFENGNENYDVLIYGNGINQTFQSMMQDSLTITPLEAGIYTIVVTNSMGCSQTEMLVLEPSSLDDINNNQTIRVYPNPAQDVLHIDADKQEVTKIKIITITGSILMDIKNPSSGTLDISTLHEGSYMLMMHNKEGNLIYNQKFVKLNP